MGEGDAAVIAGLLVDHAGAGVVSDLRRLTAGASRETWSAVVDAVPVVVQRQRADASTDVMVEATVLGAAAGGGVPVPAVVAAIPAGSAPDGRATLVTRRVDGETIARRILRDDRYAAARGRLGAQLGDALALLHRIPVDEAPGLEEIDALERAVARMDELGQPHPAFELALRWLDANRPERGRRAIVHGDYRLGNVIVDDDGLAAVLDWELAHVGDPIEDLGWLCVPAWRFGGPHAVAGVATRTAVRTAYEAAAGYTVDPDEMFWWEVCGIVRWGIICVSQADAHRSGTVRSHELAAIGRRVCETEHDLFLALEGRW